MTSPSVVPDELAAMLEEYEILSEIGRGAVSVVYRARDRELDRKVAIKVIRSPFLDDEEASARVDREARTLARLHHPNIITLLAARRLPDGRLALVTELARGMTLRQALNELGTLSPPLTTEVLRQIGDALAHLHRCDIVHRDVKTENIFIEEDGRVVLSDLGIAKVSDAAKEITMAGVMIGTPAYMSPEQIDGLPLDGRSDQYSLALVGYELLTGRRAWDGENVYTMIYKQKHEALPRLAERCPGVPTYLEETIERALAKDRELRWPDMDEFVGHLVRGSREHDHRSQQALASLSHAAPAAGPAAAGGATGGAAGSVQDRSRRRPAAVAAVVALVVGFAAAAVGAGGAAGPLGLDRFIGAFRSDPAATAVPTTPAAEAAGPAAPTAPAAPPAASTPAQRTGDAAARAAGEPRRPPPRASSSGTAAAAGRPAASQAAWLDAILGQQEAVRPQVTGGPDHAPSLSIAPSVRPVRARSGAADTPPR